MGVRSLQTAVLDIILDVMVQLSRRVSSGESAALPEISAAFLPAVPAADTPRAAAPLPRHRRRRAAVASEIASGAAGGEAAGIGVQAAVEHERRTADGCTDTATGSTGSFALPAAVGAAAAPAVPAYKPAPPKPSPAPTPTAASSVSAAAEATSSGAIAASLIPLSSPSALQPLVAAALGPSGSKDAANGGQPMPPALSFKGVKIKSMRVMQPEEVASLISKRVLQPGLGPGLARLESAVGSAEKASAGIAEGSSSTSPSTGSSHASTPMGADVEVAEKGATGAAAGDGPPTPSGAAGMKGGLTSLPPRQFRGPPQQPAVAPHRRADESEILTMLMSWLQSFEGIGPLPGSGQNGTQVQAAHVSVAKISALLSGGPHSHSSGPIQAFHWISTVFAHGMLPCAEFTGTCCVCGLN